MNRLLLLIALGCSFPTLYAQEKLGSYEMSFFDKAYDVQGSEAGKFYVDCATLDARHKMGGFIVEGKEVDAFKASFMQARDKFTEWSNLAKQNGVTDLDKEMEIDFPRLASYFQYGDLHFAFGQRAKFRFKIMKDGRHVLLAGTGELTASDNQFMKIDGLIFAFKTADEVDAMLQLLDPQKLAEHFAAKKQKADLFK